MSTLISIMTDTIFPFIIGVFSDALNTITSNPILFLPVLLALCGTVIFYVISLIRRFGVRGASAGGRRRRRRG